MSLSITFRSRSRRTDEVLRSLANKVRPIIDDTAEDVRRDYAAGVGVRSGDLRNSAFTEKTGDLKSIVGSRLKYAFWHEFGTRYFAGNPALRRALNKHKANFKNRMNRLIGKLR